MVDILFFAAVTGIFGYVTGYLHGWDAGWEDCDEYYKYFGGH